MNVKATLKRLETKQAKTGEFSDILRLIREGKRYSELTDEQKERYCRYRYGISHGVIEEVEQMVTGKKPDFVLEKRPPEMSPDEEKRHIKAIADEIQRDFFG